MLKIYKYPIRLERDGIIYLSLPEGAQVLTLQLQNGEPMLWALVNPNKPLVGGRRFRILGTGQPIDNGDLKYLKSSYVGTWQKDNYVWHLFED